MCRQRGNRTTGCTVVGRNNRINLVVLRGQDLLHVALCVGWQPAVGIGFGNDGDVACVNRGLQHFLLAAPQEIGVRIGGRPLDHDVVALGHGFQNGAGLHAADFDVVEGQIERTGVFDQTVIADNRNTFVSGSCDGRADRLAVLRQNDQCIYALGDQAFHVGQLLGRRRLRVRADVFRTGGFQSSFDRGFVCFPALFLKVGPADADGDVLCGGGVGESGSGDSRCHKEFTHFFPPR